MNKQPSVSDQSSKKKGFQKQREERHDFGAGAYEDDSLSWSLEGDVIRMHGRRYAASHENLERGLSSSPHLRPPPNRAFLEPASSIVTNQG